MADTSALQDVLSYIQREWTVMTEENCVPVQVALQLMDSSSLGRAHQSDQFSQTYKQLQKALQAVVNEHLQDFSSTLGTFHAIQASLRESQNRMNALRHEQLQAIPEKLEGTPTNKPIYQFLENLDLSSPMVDDASRNPEVDTFYYIHLLLEALGKMDQLELAVSSIEQRMPTELFRLVERTNAEIELRHRDAVRPSPSIAKGDDGLGLADDDLRETIISDLLCTLYSKFQAIAEAHRVLHEVITGMLQRKNIEEASPLTGGFKELWKLYQNERVFMFSHIDSTTPELASAQDDLEAILKTSVPGLVSESRRLMLVEPSVFNMTYLLAPSLSFIQRLKEIVPSTAKIDINNLTSFLDDFLVNVFHPQLDEALTDLSAQIFIELDAFQQDPQSADGSKRPIFKQPGQLQEEAELLITYTHETPLEPSDLISDRKSIASLCLLYNSMKWLVRQLSRLRRLVDDDHSSEPDIITRPGGRRGVQWILQDPRQTRTDPSTVYLPLTKDNVASYDATLTSYEELATSVLLTLHMEIRATLILHVTKSLRNNYLLSQPIAVPDPGLLSLNGDLVAFDEILSTHLLRLPAHRPAAASTQPAPGSRAPRSHEHAFVTTGLAILVDTMLVRNAGQIGAMNRTGCDRMRLNMLVLQQNLNSIDRGHGDGHPPHPHSVFHRSPEYFDLFLAGPDAILRQAAEEKKSSGGGGGGGDGTPFVFGYDALKVLLELCYSENLASDRREVAVQAKKALNDHLFALSEQTWEAR
ncbi:MAG: hypothetical protein M1826_005515 [Phylliscum demangeonii]|nr:MAG: hypothetical protein M1826_005515 [Phylliscum demangeonii]